MSCKPILMYTASLPAWKRQHLKITVSFWKNAEGLWLLRYETTTEAYKTLLLTLQIVDFADGFSSVLYSDTLSISKIMILTDKTYIETPSGGTSLMHYLNIYQLLSVLKSEQLIFSSVSLYEDAAESTLSFPSYEEVRKHLLWEGQLTSEKRQGLRIS